MRIVYSSSAIMASINDLDGALLIQILVRLPSAISRIQCKLVSKFWNSIISTPNFFHHHIPFALIRSNWNLPLDYNFVSHDPITRSMKLELPSSILHNSHLQTSAYQPPGMIIEASCNDLLLLASYTDLSLPGKVSYHICNPFTHDSVALPPSPSQFDYYRNALVGLVCCHDYHCKVVRIVEFDSEFRMLIFSSDTNQWTDLAVLNPCFNYSNEHIYSVQALSWNGILHWLAFLNDNRMSLVVYNLSDGGRLCSIDLPGEVFQHHLGEQHSFGLPCIGVGICKGRLRLVHLARYERTSFHLHDLRVFELNGYEEEGWILTHEVPMYSRRRRWVMDEMEEVNEFMTKVKAVYLDPNDEDVVYFFILDTHIVSFNMNTKKLGKVDCSWKQSVPLESREERLRSYRYHSFQLLLPCWPTVLPALSVNVRI